MQVDLQVPLEVDSVVQAGRTSRYAARRQRAAARGRRRRKVGTHAARSPCTTMAGRAWREPALGRRAHLGPGPRRARRGSRRHARAWARASGGPPRTSSPTSPTASASRSPCRIRCRPSPTGASAASSAAGDGWTTYEWFVSDPINNYDVAAYIGATPPTPAASRASAVISPSHSGPWPATPTGPRPVAPGRAHAALLRGLVRALPLVPGRLSADRGAAPGDGASERRSVRQRFANGYKGKDLCGTGWGLTWDFIVVHESAHEWFGNSITAADVADNWVHESFANYAESLFTECQFGTAAGAEYVRGIRKLIKNDGPIVGRTASTPRARATSTTRAATCCTPSARWSQRQHLAGDPPRVQRAVRARHCERPGVQEYISQRAGVDLRPVFAQYLTTTRIPDLRVHQRRWDPPLPLGRRGRRIRHAGPGTRPRRATPSPSPRPPCGRPRHCRQGRRAAFGWTRTSTC